MKRILITAFGSYGSWEQNSSWLTLVELTKQLPADAQLVTRRYPVDLVAARTQLSDDLRQAFDFAIHLGQAPGSSGLALERVALNAYQDTPGAPAETLEADGPLAYETRLPLERWRIQLSEAGVPSSVSFHAGTYLCNALFYWSRYFSQQLELATESVFIHLPLTPQQTATMPIPHPSLPAERSAEAVRAIIRWMASAHAA